MGSTYPFTLGFGLLGLHQRPMTDYSEFIYLFIKLKHIQLITIYNTNTIHVSTIVLFIQ